MPKLIVFNDGVVVKEVQLTKDRSTIGRRPYNDIVIDNLAVSGEHAAIVLSGGQALLEDLGSTNGTFVNGSAVTRQVLEHDDLIEVGKYRIQYLDATPSSFAAASLAPAAAPARASRPAELGGEALSAPMGIDAPAAGVPLQGARVRVLNGSAAGREMALVKVVTTVGKPGLCVAAITHKGHGYDLTHVDGERVATVNGVAVDAGPITLTNRDQIDLGGIRLEFVDP